MICTLTSCRSPRVDGQGHFFVSFTCKNTAFVFFNFIYTYSVFGSHSSLMPPLIPLGLTSTNFRSYLFLTHSVWSVLSTYSWVLGFALEQGQPSRGHGLIENKIFLPQKPSLVAHCFSVRGWGSQVSKETCWQADWPNGVKAAPATGCSWAQLLPLQEDTVLSPYSPIRGLYNLLLCQDGPWTSRLFYFLILNLFFLTLLYVYHIYIISPSSCSYLIPPAPSQIHGIFF